MNSRTKITLVVVGLLAVIIAVRGWIGLSAQPQLKADEEVFKTVDALFTAITAHNATQLAACEKRLESYRSAGQIPASAAERLTSVITTARAGQWEAAARRLYDFIEGQKREAAATSSG